MTDTVFLYVTAPSNDEAGKIAKMLVTENLAACVNILGEITSVYRWDGAIEEGQEIALIVKTTAELSARACERVTALHSYDTPCVTALPVSQNGSNPAFLEWIASSTKT